MPLDGFTFAPAKLGYGKNVISVSYTSNTGQEFSITVPVYAEHPRLLSLSARLTGGDTGKVNLGTTLDASMFEVSAIYEDGRSAPIDGFSIDPVTMDEEGEHTVTIAKDGATTQVNVIVQDPRKISERERETNDETASANPIEAYARYVGNLSNDQDVDYYCFRSGTKGRVRLVLQHDKMDSDDTYWVATLLDSRDSNSIVSLRSIGSAVETRSPQARIGPGMYYIKIESYYHSSNQYTLVVESDEEDETFETEPNNSIEDATPLEPSSDHTYTGNLQSDGDVDYYAFKLPQKGKVYLGLTHDKHDDGNTYWSVTLLGQDSGELLNLNSHRDEMSVTSDAVRLDAGEYYVRIKPYYWIDEDYHVTVTYSPEANDAETEPNGDYGNASVLALGTYMRGNIQNDTDVDFYTFGYQGNGSLWVYFHHERSDNEDALWQVRLYDKASSSPIANSDGNEALVVHGNDADEVSSAWNGLAPGEYSIKVEKYYYDNSDYMVGVAAA